MFSVNHYNKYLAQSSNPYTSRHTYPLEQQTKITSGSVSPKLIITPLVKVRPALEKRVSLKHLRNNQASSLVFPRFVTYLGRMTRPVYKTLENSWRQNRDGKKNKKKKKIQQKKQKKYKFFVSKGKESTAAHFDKLTT